MGTKGTLMKQMREQKRRQQAMPVATCSCSLGLPLPSTWQKPEVLTPSKLGFGKLVVVKPKVHTGGK